MSFATPLAQYQESPKVVRVIFMEKIEPPYEPIDNNFTFLKNIDHFTIEKIIIDGLQMKRFSTQGIELLRDTARVELYFQYADVYLMGLDQNCGVGKISFLESVVDSIQLSEFLQYTPGLRQLDIHYTHIDLACLGSVRFQALREIWFQSAHVDSWSHLVRIIDNSPLLTRLTILSSFFDAPEVLQRRKFTHLALSSNQNIQDLSFLQHQSELQTFSCCSNPVSQLKPIRYCFKLRELRISYCQVYDPEELHHLQNLSKLTLIDATENPCVRHPGFDAALHNFLDCNPVRFILGLRDVELDEFQDIIYQEKRYQQINKSAIVE